MEIDDGKPEPGRLFVIAAPSGAGKTTLVHRLMKTATNLDFSVSYTTRPKRSTEVDGRDYHFVGKPEFEAMIAGGDFLEYAEVFDNFYGTSKSQVESMLNTGRNVVLEIDWQGAQQVRSHMPDCRSVFILPPSVEALDERLRGRGTDSDSVIKRRYRDAIADLSHWHEFDYAVINDDLVTATAELQAIIEGRDAAELNATSNAALRGKIEDIVG